MIKALIPIKTESQRLPNKNFLDFCGKPLYQIILDKLHSIDLIDQLIINTDSELIAEDCAKRYDKLLIIKRPNHLLGNDITMNAIIDYDLEHVDGEHFLQTHCTNPLLSEKTIGQAITNYFKSLNEYDSLLSIESIKKRAYTNVGKPINHSNLNLLPTQLLPEINIENSNLFLFSRTSFSKNNKSRVGAKPQLFKMSALEGIDIDFKEDFLLAELLYKNKIIFDCFD
jgi:CMP-N-acetylneuraminic acid synthetase